MARTLKVFKTHIGFYDLIVAAPSMKAAADAWNSDVKIFAQGFAARTENAEEVKAASAEPGVVLRRAHGGKGAYSFEAPPVRVPKMSAAKKLAAAKAEKKREAAEKKAKADEARRAKRDAAAELAEIERQESQLRQKRRQLQKKFRLHAVK